jgi:Na+/proline symporter
MDMLPNKAILRLEEIAFIALLIGGFIVALATSSAMIFYGVAFLTGMLFGRLWFQTRKGQQFKYLIMIVCFIVGFIFGNFLMTNYRPGNPYISILLYVIGIIAGYKISKKGYLSIVDF